MEALHVVLCLPFDHKPCLVTSDYERGYAEGYAVREAEFEALSLLADHWYFRACNPTAKTADQKMIESIIEGMDVREERRKKREELDAAEARLFDQARELIANTDLSDVQIAVQVGLFAPVVANLRAGVL
jgi:hypothetical protein